MQRLRDKNQKKVIISNVSQQEVASIYRIMHLLLIALLFLSVSSCNNNPSDTVENEIDTISEKISTAMDDVKEEYNEYRDDNFIKTTYKNNEEELHLLSLAMKNGTEKNLISVANNMHKDHEKLGNLLRDYAATKNVDINSDQPTDMLDSKPKGREWDKDWLDKVKRTHEKTIEKFEDAHERTTDEELKMIIANSLPALQAHLDAINNLENKIR